MRKSLDPTADGLMKEQIIQIFGPTLEPNGIEPNGAQDQHNGPRKPSPRAAPNLAKDTPTHPLWLTLGNINQVGKRNNKRN